MLYLIRANPKEFALLDQRRLNDADSWAHLAVAGNDHFVRELNALAVYLWTTSATFWETNGGRLTFGCIAPVNAGPFT